MIDGDRVGRLIALPIEPGIRAKLWAACFCAGLAALAVPVAAGVTLSPRFDYDLRYEIAQEEIMTGTTAKETERMAFLRTCVLSRTSFEPAH